MIHQLAIYCAEAEVDFPSDLRGLLKLGDSIDIEYQDVGKTMKELMHTILKEKNFSDAFVQKESPKNNLNTKLQNWDVALKQNEDQISSEQKAEGKKKSNVEIQRGATRTLLNVLNERNTTLYVDSVLDFLLQVKFVYSN